MSDSNFTEKPLLEKIQDLLERKPGMCDVAFCVGKEKKIVRALKVILKASSPFLEKEFEEKWEVAVVKEGDGIPLPDFDPTAFELFVKLTSLDTWSLENLRAFNLPLTLILNLVSICGRFEIIKEVENLETLATAFLQSFSQYKDTDDFLQLSQTNLKYVLGSDDIRITELDLFHAAMRWAEFQCKKMKVQPTDERIREVLGECLFEIRFPIMSFTEFTKTAESNDILTAEETIGIYRFIGLEATKKLEFDTKKLLFKTTQRKQGQTLESKHLQTDTNKALMPPGILTLSLNRDLKIVKNPPFVCDGSSSFQRIVCEKKITVYGLGFLGPIESDEYYDVKIQIKGYCGIRYDSGTFEKRIFAEKGKNLYFIFDAPIDLEAGGVRRWNNFYQINFCLKGANTFACNGEMYYEYILQEEDTRFGLECYSHQLAEILYKLK